MTLLVDASGLEIVLSAAERAASFHGSSIRVPRASIERVQLTDNPWTWLRGSRRPGSMIPRVLAAGTWRSVSGADFVLLHGRRPGVVIDLRDGADYRRMLLTTRHGKALVDALQAERGEAAESAEPAGGSSDGQEPVEESAG